MRGEYKHFMDDNNVEEPLAVAFVGGAKLKTLINDWDGSKFQKYINGLLANLQKVKRSMCSQMMSQLCNLLQRSVKRVKI